jgi:EAL domain-containing protein (putative c-di-GMP-specific phosphodiesterase class I)/ActR/RegA family two-component response regulator
MSSPDSPPTEALRPESVLIVDDSRVQRDHTASLCRELGMRRIQEAGNGREALALLAASRPLPDLLIIDLEMPTMDGMELLEQLQQQCFDVPIVVSSAQAPVLIHSVQDLGGVLGLRILDAVQKPLNIGSLRAALLKVNSPAGSAKQAPVLPIGADELRQALAAGHIEVHFQPKADIRSGVVRGVEALARWCHPTYGWVPTEKFIAIAESSGLIHQLTIEVMNQALLQAASWRARGLHLSVAINLSPLLLESSDIAQQIASLQQAHGLPPEQMVLEVTESSLVKRLGVALGVLARMRMRGFGLSIDDYGTGFASMQQLARIPFTELKIDRTFVHGAHQREHLQVILRSALDMANQLGLVTVAEGVETMQDWRLLQQFGCTLGQGWLIAKAMPAAEIGSWLKKHRARCPELREPDSASSIPSQDADLPGISNG